MATSALSQEGFSDLRLCFAAVPDIGNFRLQGFGAATGFLSVDPVRMIFLVEGKAVLLQVVLGQNSFIICVGVPKGKGGRRDHFPNRFLGNRMEFKGMIEEPLLDLNNLLGFFPVKNDILKTGMIRCFRG